MSKNRFKEATTNGGREIIPSPRHKFSPIPGPSLHDRFLSAYPTPEQIFSKRPLRKFQIIPGELPYEIDGDARRKIQIKSLRETSVVVAQA